MLIDSPSYIIGIFPRKGSPLGYLYGDNWGCARGNYRVGALQLLQN